MSVSIVVFGAVALLVGVGAVLWNAWRYPEKACWRCDGNAWKKTFSLLFSFRVRGACRKCHGYGWKPRRLSKWFGWDVDTHRW